MLNPEKILGGLISGALGGGRSGKTTRAIAKGAIGLAIAGVEHLKEKHRQGQQESATTTGSGPPQPPGSATKAPSAPPPPPPGAAPGPPPSPASTNSATGEYDAVLLIRAMIASAYADGELDASERAKIIKRLEKVDLDTEERSFIQAELDQPKDPAELVAGVKSTKMAQQVYAVSLMAVEVDTEAEKTYLNQLADSLGLTRADRVKVHDIVKVPLF